MEQLRESIEEAKKSLQIAVDNRKARRARKNQNAIEPTQKRAYRPKRKKTRG